jgi:hypothetical protein
MERSAMTWRRMGAWLVAGTLLTLSLPVLAEGIAVHGTVLEKGTRKPILGAEVFVVDNDELVATTDADGVFTLMLPAAGEYLLGVAAVGYERGPHVPVNARESGATVEIYLQATFSLPDVVVRAERNPNRAAKTVMTGDEMRSVPGTAGDPLKALQALPGIAVATDASSAPAIRGSRPEDNAYYVDDLPVGYLFHMGGIVSVLNGDLVDSFNLHAAAFGPEYGNVTGAVIDSTLRNPRTDRFGGKFNLSFIGADALVEGPVTERQSFFLSARRSYLDLVVEQVSDDEAGETFEVPEYYDYQGKYVWQASADNTVTLHANGAGDEMAVVLTEDSDTVKQEPDLIGRTSFGQSYHAQAATWDLRSPSGAHNRVILGHTLSAGDSTVGAAGETAYSSDTWYLREQWHYALTPAHALLLGASAVNSRWDIDLDIKNPRCTEFEAECSIGDAPRLQLDDAFTVHVWELYARDRWQVAPAWTLVGGVRFSYEDFLKDRFTEPRLALEWQARAGTLLTAGWGRHHQFPRGEQVIEVFGNPDLHQIRAEHAVLGVEQKFAAVWSLKLETYYKTFDDLVVADPDVNYVNGASGEAYGLEALLKKEQQGAWSGWLSLSLSESSRRNDLTGETFVYEFDQPVIATLVLNYKPSAEWTFGAKWNYHSGNPYTRVFADGFYDDGRVKPGYGPINEDRLPAYHRLDLRAERHYVFDTWKLNAYVDLINAYNRRNVSGYSYNADYSERTATYQLPLIPSFGVQAEF